MRFRNLVNVVYTFFLLSVVGGIRELDVDEAALPFLHGSRSRASMGVPKVNASVPAAFRPREAAISAEAEISGSNSTRIISSLTATALNTSLLGRSSGSDEKLMLRTNSVSLARGGANLTKAVHSDKQPKKLAGLIPAPSPGWAGAFVERFQAGLVISQGCYVDDSGNALGCRVDPRCSCSIIESCYPHHSPMEHFGGQGFGDTGVCSLHVVALMFSSILLFLSGFLLMMCLRRSTFLEAFCCFPIDDEPPVVAFAKNEPVAGPQQDVKPTVAPEPTLEPTAKPIQTPPPKATQRTIFQALGSAAAAVANQRRAAAAAASAAGSALMFVPSRPASRHNACGRIRCD
eukprot:TRINITY_DN75867_c0_g1_i1.p1 TRINITY_DN75867_c0_g1~~TRINITY_DN75867_c0_g1_i1.p1  ORF type:complete len:346 (+),score=45.93 TRINITY_DN75867_c0_g1_i1:142-1179(+)